jgi:Domain of unknown function (DUF397)
VAANWRKPLRSFANGNCAEVASTGGVVLIRDTRDRPGPVLRFPARSWQEFTRAVRGPGQ